MVRGGLAQPLAGNNQARLAAINRDWARLGGNWLGARRIRIDGFDSQRGSVHA